MSSHSKILEKYHRRENINQLSNTLFSPKFLLSDIKINIQLKNKPWSKIYSITDSTNIPKQHYKMVYVNLAVMWEHGKNNKPL